jgi:prepilin-type processing-associated H-X9-DG protein
MFAQEHQGFLPKAYNNGGAVMRGSSLPVGKTWEFSNAFWCWEHVVMKYTRNNKALFNCPADTEPRIRYTWNDTMSNPPVTDPTYDNVAASYRYNWSNELYNHTLPYSQRVFTSPKITQIKPADRAIIFIDGTQGAQDQINYQDATQPDKNHVDVKAVSDSGAPDGTLIIQHRPYWTVNNPWNVAFRRHSVALGRYNDAAALKKGQANYAFMDGHVETLAWEETWVSLGEKKTPWQVTGFGPWVGY